MTATTDKMLARKEGRVGTHDLQQPRAPQRGVARDVAGRHRNPRRLRQGRRRCACVVVTGAGGKAFVSGADISKFEDERATREARRALQRHRPGVLFRARDFPKPTIAQIQGYCIGGGLNLAIGCDLRFCTRGLALRACRPPSWASATATPASSASSTPSAPPHTKDIFFSARQFGAAEALAMGVVNRVLPEAELAGFVAELCADHRRRTRR